ncbi:MAG: hypothetical protein GY715_21765 [Planctomycetes bacterium]|nr:hypothetical protein [Planctomycetota bacterium]
MVSRALMNCTRLELLLRRSLPGLTGAAGGWRAEVDGTLVYVIADETHDRMRLMVPVTEVDLDDPELLWTLLCANFDRALDATYAVHDGLLWTVFVHRLSWLTEAELNDALAQVLTLARNTGTSFSSSDLVFGGQ